MRILSKYILKEIITYFLISLVVFTGILFTLRVLKLTSLIVNKGVLLSQVTVVFVSVIPAFLEIAVPLAALLGPMLTFARLSGDSEIIVIRASGISLIQLVRPIILFGILAAALGLFVSHELKPWGFRNLSSTLFQIARTKSTAGLEPGVFNDLGEITLYAEEIDQKTGDLEQVLIEDRRKEDAPRVIVARSGRILSDESERTIIFDLKDGEIHEDTDTNYTLTRYVTNKLIMDADKLSGADEEQKRKRARELTWNELATEKKDLIVKRQKALEDEADEKSFGPVEEEIAAIKESAGFEEEESLEEITNRLHKINFEQQTRFSLPVAALLLALIGMPLGIQSPRSQRTWGAGLSALIGLMVFLVYFAMFSLAKTLAEDGTISALLAAWCPNGITLLVGAYLLRQMSTERWQTISEGIEHMLASVHSLFVFRGNQKEQLAAE